MDWCLLSPSDLSRILPVGGGLLFLCPLPGPPVVKITHASIGPGQGGRFQSVVPLTISLVEMALMINYILKSPKFFSGPQNSLQNSRPTSNYTSLRQNPLPPHLYRHISTTFYDMTYYWLKIVMKGSL